MTRTTFLRVVLRTMTALGGVWLCAQGVALAQTHLGTIRGSILDPSGAAVSRAA